MGLPLLAKQNKVKKAEQKDSEETIITLEASDLAKSPTTRESLVNTTLFCVRISTWLRIILITNVIELAFNYIRFGSDPEVSLIFDFLGYTELYNTYLIPFAIVNFLALKMFATALIWENDKYVVPFFFWKMLLGLSQTVVLVFYTLYLRMGDYNAVQPFVARCIVYIFTLSDTLGRMLFSGDDVVIKIDAINYILAFSNGFVAYFIYKCTGHHRSSASKNRR